MTFLLINTRTSKYDNMATAGDIYERELKALLSGDTKSITKMVKTCDDEESKSYNSLIDNPFLVIRAAGSLGVDIVSLRWDFSFPIEVKSSVDDTIHFSRTARLTEQAEKMQETCGRSHLVPIYAFRLKSVRGDPWRIFTIPTEGRLRGHNEILRKKIPKLEVTSNGNYVMRWEDGIKLSSLISYMGAMAFDDS